MKYSNSQSKSESVKGGKTNDAIPISICITNTMWNSKIPLQQITSESNVCTCSVNNPRHERVPSLHGTVFFFFKVAKPSNSE